jgi:hypothetical protein
VPLRGARIVLPPQGTCGAIAPEHLTDERYSVRVDRPGVYDHALPCATEKALIGPMRAAEAGQVEEADPGGQGRTHDPADRQLCELTHMPGENLVAKRDRARRG